MNNDVITVSRLVTNSEGKTYLEVDGKPVLYNAVQSWYPPESDYELYMKKAVEVNYRIFTFWLCWRHLEPIEGEYNWGELDRVIDLANGYDLRLDIVWAGTNFCGHLDQRFAPDWLLNRHPWHLKDGAGNCVNLNAYDFNTSHGIDCTNKEALSKEKKFVTDMMQHIKNYDINHRVILFQTENEVNINAWTGQAKRHVLEYCNGIGDAVKKSGYIVATRMNLVEGKNDKDVNNLPSIDFHGPDPYTSKIEDIKSIIYDIDNSRMPYIAENAAYENSTPMMATAFTGGGFYNIYRLDYDDIWNKPGVYDKKWGYWSVTDKIKSLNKAMNKIDQLIASSPKSKMAGFYIDGADNSNVDYFYKSISGKKFGVRFSVGNSACMIIEKNREYFIVADSFISIIIKGQPGPCELGYIDQNGNWNMEADKNFTKVSKSGYMLVYNPEECIKVKY